MAFNNGGWFKHSRIQIGAFAVLSILIWGVTFVSTRVLLEEFSALEIMVGRFVLAYEVLWLIAPKRMKVKGWRDELMLAGMGLLGAVVYQLLENCAIYYTDACNVSMLTAAGPILTAIIVRVLGGERLNGWRFWVGALLAASGVVLISTNGIVALKIRPIGDLMILVAMFSWSFYTLLVKKINERGYEQMLVIRRAFFWTLVFLLPVAIWGTTESGWMCMDGSFSINLNWAENKARLASLANISHFAFLGALASALCFVWWNVACKRLGAVKATLFIYFIPVVTIVTSFLFMDEMPTVVGLAGSLMVIVGVAVSNMKARAV